MKVLIVKDYSTTLPWGQQTVESIRSHVQRSCLQATVDVCAAADGETVPSPSEYDLIFLTGGTFDLINTPPSPWVQNVLGLIRDFSQQRGGNKLVGFCWGHQVIQFASGGKLGLLDGGARVSWMCIKAIAFH